MRINKINSLIYKSNQQDEYDNKIKKRANKVAYTLLGLGALGVGEMVFIATKCNNKSNVFKQQWEILSQWIKTILKN